MNNTISEVAAILGRKGGKNTLKRYGKEHFVEMGKRSGEKKRAKKVIPNPPLDKQSLV